MNFASLPTDQSYGNVPSTNSTIADILLGAYKNNLTQKEMQKQKAAQDAQQYAQPFGNEQDLMQQQMKMLQGYRPPEVQNEAGPSAAEMEQYNKQAQAEALSKYMNSGNEEQSTQPTTTTTDTAPVATDPNIQSTPLGQMPPINTNAKYGQTTPNPMLMDGGEAPGQQPVQAVSPQLPQQQGPMQALQQGIQQPVQQQPIQQQGRPQQKPQVDYSNIDTLPSSGNAKMDALDKAWLQNPAAVENQFGLSGSRKTIPNLANGQMIEQTTLPSGRSLYNVQKITDASNGVTVFDQNTGQPLVQMGGSGNVARSQFPPLEKGEGYYYKTDNQGQPVVDSKGQYIPEGKLVPLTQEDRDENAGRYMMNKIYPKVNTIQSNYWGKGSYDKYKSDVDYVSEHPEEDSAQRRRLVDLETAKKLITPLGVKEQATLKASGTLGMFRVLNSSLTSTDIPDIAKKYAEFKLPSSVMAEAGNNFLDIITNTTQEANDQIPAYRRAAFDSSDKKSESLKNAAKNSSSSEKDPFAQYKVGA